jgi:hypothetical protein
MCGLRSARGRQGARRSRIAVMTASNSWAEFAVAFLRTRSAHLEHEAAKAGLKGLVPADAHQAFGHGIRAKRSKSGAISFDLLAVEDEQQRASETIGALAGALAKAQTELVKGENRRFAMPHSQAGLKSCAKFSASMKLRPGRRPPRSSGRPA